MDLFSVLAERHLDEVGLLDCIGPEDKKLILEDSIRWIERSHPTSPRTIWFPAPDGFPTTAQLTPELKSRFVPMETERAIAWSQLGPFPALLTRVGTPELDKRYLPWLSTGAYSAYGSMERVGDFSGWTLWAWKSSWPARRALMICHHSGVLPDVRRQLRLLGIRGEFVWLCDGKPPTGDAWPSQLGPLDSSIPLLHGDIDTVVPDSLLDSIKESYDMIITSHCMRYPLLFQRTGLPLLHINSTRFGNEITCREEFVELRRRLRSVSGTQLTIVHNNWADKWYAETYLGFRAPVISSLCDQALRFRISAPGPKFLLWDTRGHARGGGSTLFREILARLGGRCDITSTLTPPSGWLDDDMLADYRAVIHVPYNISTMSCFEQAAAGIPLWIPSAELLREALREYSEVSWYCFQADKTGAERPDQVWDTAVLDEFIRRSDFRKDILGTILEFHSVDDLVSRIDQVDYDTIPKQALGLTVARKKKAIDAWATTLRPIPRAHAPPQPSSTPPHCN